MSEAASPGGPPEGREASQGQDSTRPDLAGSSTDGSHWAPRGRAHPHPPPLAGSARLSSASLTVVNVAWATRAGHMVAVGELQQDPPQVRYRAPSHSRTGTTGLGVPFPEAAGHLATWQGLRSLVRVREALSPAPGPLGKEPPQPDSPAFQQLSLMRFSLRIGALRLNPCRIQANAPRPAPAWEQPQCPQR